MAAATSLTLKVNLVLLAVGTVVFFIAFGGYGWASGEVSSDVSYRFGLWVGCTTLEIKYQDGSSHTGEVCSTSIPWMAAGAEAYPRGELTRLNNILQESYDDDNGNYDDDDYHYAYMCV
jgi:hypothetical protein